VRIPGVYPNPRTRTEIAHLVPMTLEIMGMTRFEKNNCQKKITLQYITFTSPITIKYNYVILGQDSGYYSF
jgi:hypothetical protein